MQREYEVRECACVCKGMREQLKMSPNTPDATPEDSQEEPPQK